MKSCCVGVRGASGENQRLAELEREEGDGQMANDFIVKISGRHADSEGREVSQ